MALCPWGTPDALHMAEERVTLRGPRQRGQSCVVSLSSVFADFVLNLSINIS